MGSKDTHRDYQSCEDLWLKTSVDTEINEHMQERWRFPLVKGAELH